MSLNHSISIFLLRDLTSNLQGEENYLILIFFFWLHWSMRSQTSKMIWDLSLSLTCSSQTICTKNPFPFGGLFWAWVLQIFLRNILRKFLSLPGISHFPMTKHGSYFNQVTSLPLFCLDGRNKSDFDKHMYVFRMFVIDLFLITF